MKKARFNLTTSYPEGDVDVLPDFYVWLKAKLIVSGFEFAEGNPCSWEELKNLSPKPLTHDSDFPYINFYQG